MNGRIQVIAANRVLAKIFETEGRHLSLRLELKHPEGELRNRDIDTDRGGQSFDKGSSRGHVTERHVSAHETDAIRFAKEVAAAAERSRLEGVGRFVLVAEPHFLGLLRGELGEQVSKLIIGDVGKDLAAASEGDLRRAVSEVLPLLEA